MPGHDRGYLTAMTKQRETFFTYYTILKEDMVVNEVPDEHTIDNGRYIYYTIAYCLLQL